VHEIVDIAENDVTAAKTARTPSVARFCRDVGRVVDTVAPCDVPRRVAELLPVLLLQPDLLTPAQRRAPADGYGRNRVFLCPHDKFSVLAMVWPAGVSTPIHDHRDWCALGVYEGLIEETYYAPVSKAADCTAAVPTSTVRHRRGAVAHLPVDAPNIHRIHNPTDKPAISIHVYGGNCETRGPNLDRIYDVS